MHIDNYIPITRAKARLLDIMRELQNKGIVYAITKNGVPEAVLISMEQFEAMVETMEILADKKAMRQLEASIEAEKKGHMVDMDSIL